jgi:lipopolysaccharide biosynthesis glycosyltransferase
MPPTPANEKGYWESMDLFAIHEEILHRAGTSWEDFMRFPEAWFTSEEAQGFQQKILTVLRKEFGTAPLFVVKDPRICRLVPLWLGVLRQFESAPGFVFMLRHPLEVAASLEARDGLPRANSLLLWLQHLIEAEKATRGQRRSFVSYDALLADWRTEINKIGHDLGVSWPELTPQRCTEIDTFLSIPLRHHEYSEKELDAYPEIGQWVKRVYRAVMQAAKQGTAKLQREFDAVRHELENSDTAYGPIIANLRADAAKQVSKRDGRIVHLTQSVAEQGGQVAALNEALQEREVERDRLNETLAERTRTLAQVKADLEAQQRALAKSEERIIQLNQTVTERDGCISDLGRTLSQHDAQIDFLTQSAAERDAEAKDLASKLRTQEARAEKAEAELAERDAEAKDLASKLRTQEARAEKLKTDLEWRDLVIRELRNSTSWRITAPVRAVKTGLAKIARGLRAIPAAIRFGGGVLPTARKAARVLHREGITGVKWRMENAQIVENASPTPTAQYKISHKTVTNVGGNDFKGGNVSYLALRQEVLDSGLWDEKWYLSKYYENYIKYKRNKSNEEYLFPLDYYLQEGWKLGHEPSNLLPIQINQQQVGCSKIEYFLHRLRFAGSGYQFDENVWIPSEKRIEEYLSQKQRRNSTRVIYTCIVQGYDELMQPYYIAADWDYVCFTDDPDLISQGNVGVWEIRPMSNTQSSATRTNRWCKMHPHVLFPEYEESIYVDGNINILSDYIFNQITKRGARVLLPEHFARNCIYKEIETLLRSRRISSEDKSVLVTHRQFLEQEGFPEEFGLSENNLIYRRHHDDSIVKLMRAWWDMYGKYSSRDQTVLAYVFWKNELSLRAHMFVNCRVNFKDFWVVKHVPDRPGQNYLRRQALTPAFDRKNVAVVFSTNEQYVPYLGVAIYSLIENASDDYNYDIVILAKGLEAALAKICDLARDRDNVSIRVYDTTALFESLPADIFHVEGYVPVETYNKCFITEILSSDYDRCVYLDSDILVLHDIRELHDIDLKGHAVGASVNVANVNAAFCKKVIKGKRFDDYLLTDLGVLDHNKYFQGGVLVLDMSKLYKMNLRARTIQTLKRIKQPIFFDQCVFNSIFYGDVCFFSLSWNHVWYMQQYSYLRGSVTDDAFFDYARSRVDPKIVHYGSGDKPQSKLGWVLSDLFWKYAYASPFIEDIRRDILARDNEVAHAIASAPDSEWYKVRLRLLVHVHLYYRDQLDVMMRAIRNISHSDYDLFVTMVERDESVERRILSEWKDARVLVLRNVGYDVYPFLHVLKQVRLSNYDFVLKIHTKNARRPGEDEVYGIKVPGHQWRDELLHAIVGSKEIFERNLTRFLEDKKLGCIGAQKFIFSTEENGEEKTYRLAEWRKKCGVEGGIHYVGGSMFLARAYPFERLKGVNMQPEDFESRQMGTKDYKNKAHIFERLFGIVIENEGFDIRGA